MPILLTTSSRVNRSLSPYAFRWVMALCVPLLSPTILADTATECASGSPQEQPQNITNLHRKNVDANSNEVYISADRAQVDPAGVSTLSGDVTVDYKQRSIRADSASYDANSGSIAVSGSVRLDSQNLKIAGGEAQFSSNGEQGSFVDANFELLDRNGRGDAKIIEVLDENLLTLQDVRYTACPQGENDWRFIAPQITINRDKQVGVGRNVRVEFKGVPILYAPYISFPVGEARKSGFLLPDFSSNDRSGTDIAVPYYWNIAPNYDALITARYLTRRGAQLGADVRYLFRHSKGEFEAEFLADDEATGEDRVHAKWAHKSSFDNGFKIEIDAEDVSDGAYFEDLTSSLAGASITHLERRVDVMHEGRNWTAGLRGQVFNTLDDTITILNEPYKRLPQIWFDANYGQPNRFNVGLYADVTNFERNDGARGWRTEAQPEISFPITGSAFIIEPKVVLSQTNYDLKELDFNGQPDQPSRTVPIYSLDGQMFFERKTGKNGERLQTLEPRIRYTHIPYVDQDTLPIFDSGTPDVNLIQLFRDNRYTSIDRIGDTDQLSIGLTTRLLNTSTGRELLTATLGQAMYFGTRSVRLPGEQFSSDSSNTIAEIGLNVNRYWNADFEYQWSPDNSRTAKSAVRLQYQPAANKVINLTYRFQRDDLEQTDLSFAWPIGDNWNIVGRWNYSLDENRTLERFAGVEYDRCCWSVRLVSRRFLNNRSGGQDTALFAQFELKGLTSIGAQVDAFLERGILGYGKENQ